MYNYIVLVVLRIIGTRDNHTIAELAGWAELIYYAVITYAIS